ncbi:outer membrane protein assembly factor BamB family protein [Lignipirellula cremea]|uniref:Pyrrolo-quinoline quinone repeat domain-containing protein n=1 Tax=Lignipirellula cremea TaxID=2528010 RepID=A0A518DZ59_9BACT|nr:PQQ-binding-like beta-propeller repeat protein [Lignipirellula cremea]QDU97122.1 hypothetical protein Pla8534_49670 [Lignipirellula cremea]
MKSSVFLITAIVLFAGPLQAEVVYRTPLSEAGQSGVCLHGDRLFLTVHAKLEGPLTGGFYDSSDIVGQCFDKVSGKLLWEVELPGSYAGRVLESWHDATSLLPVADDDHVVFHNLNGMLACYTHAGKLVWKRTWQAPDPDIKNGRMFLHGKQLLVALPSDRIAVPASKKHLALPFYQIHAIDLSTGKDDWISPTLLTHATQYSVSEWQGQPVLVASMIDLSHWKFGLPRQGFLLSLKTGQPILTFALPPTIPHQKNQLCRGKFVVTASAGSQTKFQLVDPASGEITEEFAMEKPDHYFAWNGSKYAEQPFTPEYTDRRLQGKGQPTASTVHVVGHRIFFWRYDSGDIGCLDTLTGEWVLVEAPIQVLTDKTIWNEADFQYTDGILNARSQVVNERVGTTRGIQRGGFGHTNPAWPIKQGDQLFWQGGAGVLYVIDLTKPFSPAALRWESIDTTGGSWTFGEPAVDDTHLYIRSQRELVKLTR